MGIFLVHEDGRLVEMSESPYELEDILQARLAEYPSLLGASDGGALGGRKYVLVQREAVLSPQEGTAGSWRVDHLFLDEEGIPTLVEVKRSANSQIRREVVGQMLDYAANALAYWPMEQVRSEFERLCEARGTTPEEALGPVIGQEEDPEGYWQRVKTNLEAGRLRLVFVADQIPPELKRVVEFLNSQLRSTEVLAIEVKEFAGEGMKTLVSRQIGQTAAAQQAKGIREPPAPGAKEMLYRELLTQLLARVQEAAPGWTRSTSATASWLELPAGRSGIFYSANFPATGHLRVELYIDPSQPDLRARAYRELEARKDEIEAHFGEPLSWEPLPERRASRIAIYTEGTIEQRDRWPEFIDWFADRLVRLREAVQPHVSAL